MHLVSPWCMNKLKKVFFVIIIQLQTQCNFFFWKNYWYKWHDDVNACWHTFVDKIHLFKDLPSTQIYEALLGYCLHLTKLASHLHIMPYLESKQLRPANPLPSCQAKIVFKKKKNERKKKPGKCETIAQKSTAKRGTENERAPVPMGCSQPQLTAIAPLSRILGL